MISLILGVAILLILFVFGVIAISEKVGEWALYILPIIGVIGFVLVEMSFASTPTALDVYRHRTELKITYEDNVPVDTVVIFKKEK